MKIKLNDNRLADWKFINTPVADIEKGESIYHKYNHSYGYRYRIIKYQDKFYLTQTLYESPDKYEYISVHEIKNISDAKAIIGAMINVIRKNHTKSNQDVVREA